MAAAPESPSVQAGPSPAPAAPERGATERRVHWSVGRADAWARAIDHRDRAEARALYEELGAVLEAEMAEEGGSPVLSTPDINERIRRRLAAVPGTRALDVGCGPTPVAALALADAGFATVGVDLAVSLLRIAQRTGTGKVALAAADGERLPFRPGAFDVVTCDDTLEHVFDQPAMVRELARVLRPGGRLILVTPNASGLHVLRARLRDRLSGRRLPRERYHITESHVRELRHREVRRLLRPWFRVRTVERVPFPDGGRWRWVNLALRLPGLARFCPVHFLELERREVPPDGSRSAARHYATRQDHESQTSPACVRMAVRDALVAHAPSGPAIDIGCGTGENLAALAGARVAAVGVDVAAAAAGRAAAAGLGAVLVADGARLPFATASFETAVCTEVLEHVDDPGAVLREMARVLRPGGLAVITAPNYANLAGAHKLLAERGKERRDWNPWGAHEGGYEARLTGRRLRRLAERHFHLVSVRALDYGQALTGRFRPLDRLAWSTAGGRLLRRLVPVLEDPKWPVLPWHGMHVALVLRRRENGRR